MPESERTALNQLPLIERINFFVLPQALEARPPSLLSKPALSLVKSTNRFCLTCAFRLGILRTALVI